MYFLRPTGPLPAPPAALRGTGRPFSDLFRRDLTSPGAAGPRQSTHSATFLTTAEKNYDSSSDGSGALVVALPGLWAGVEMRRKGERMALLEVDNVSVSFDAVKVLDQVSLKVERGAIACLLGPSGCGKTTLFHVVAGLSLPTAGRVLLDGRDITGVPGQLAYMLQKDLLLPEKTIVDNVSLPLVLRGVPAAKAREQALELFDTFGLSGTEHRWPAELSGGMRQRAALLRSYLFSQEFMLLDEPFSALDAFTKADLHAWFLDVADRFDTTALVVTHDIDEAIELADEIFVMRGAPQAGEPTRIVGSERIACPRSERATFALTEEFLEHKRRVLALLG